MATSSAYWIRWFCGCPGSSPRLGAHSAVEYTKRLISYRNNKNKTKMPNAKSVSFCIYHFIIYRFGILVWIINISYLLYITIFIDETRCGVLLVGSHSFETQNASRCALTAQTWHAAGISTCSLQLAACCLLLLVEIRVYKRSQMIYIYSIITLRVRALHLSLTTHNPRCLVYLNYSGRDSDSPYLIRAWTVSYTYRQKLYCCGVCYILCIQNRMRGGVASDICLHVQIAGE